MTVLEKTRQIIADDLKRDPAAISPDALLEGGNLYVSLDMLECIAACEEYFEVRFNDEDFPQIGNSVGGLARVIESKLRQKALWPGHIKDVTF